MPSDLRFWNTEGTVAPSSFATLESGHLPSIASRRFVHRLRVDDWAGMYHCSAFSTSLFSFNWPALSKGSNSATGAHTKLPTH